MRPAKGSLTNMGLVSQDTTVNDLLSYLSTHEDGVVVEDETGKVLGVVTAQGVIEALATGAEDRHVVREATK
ncbi:MAG: CBS domain-containing protein [Rhodobacteraceae bacterium]|nr:CBS domain-containing protein [Paracoccaceae bacterium]